MKRIFQAQVVAGKIAQVLLNNITDYIAKFDGKIIKITVEEKKPQRSIPQNKFYRKCIVPAVKDWLMENGIVFDLEQTHSFIVRHVWKYTKQYELPDGTFYEERRSSTESDPKLWEQYMDITRAYFADKGLILPIPEKEVPNYWLAG